MTTYSVAAVSPSSCAFRSGLQREDAEKVAAQFVQREGGYASVDREQDGQQVAAFFTPRANPSQA